MGRLAAALGDIPAPSAPRRRQAVPLVQTSTSIAPEVALADLPALIQQEVQAYLSEPAPGRALLLALPAGSGKTTAMVQVAQALAAQGQRVMYAGPRHDFFCDIVNIPGCKPTWWYEWQPRKEGTDHEPATCRWAKEMRTWLARGYEAMALCANSRVCGFDYLNTQCPYHAQRQRREPIIFAQHAHVAIAHPLMPEMNVLIGDESPLSAFLSPWRIPSGSLRTRDAAPEMEQVQITLEYLCNRDAVYDEDGTAVQWSGPRLLDELGGADHILSLCATYQLTDADVPTVRDVSEVDQADYLYLPVLLRLLEQEATAAKSGAANWVHRVRCEHGALWLLSRRRPGTLPPHIIWCDATGDGELYARLLGMPVQVVRPRVALQGTVHQVTTALNNMGSVVGEQNSEKRRKLRAQVEHLITTRNYQAPALISYKSVVQELSDIALDSTGHFGAERGTNRLEACDVLFVIGAPQPQLRQMIDMAAMLYDERTTPFRALWSDREAVPYEGTPYGWPIGGYWDEPSLQVIVRQVREAELIQAIHRARPLRRSVDIWLLTNVPLPYVPVTLHDVREVFDAPLGVDMYAWPAFRRWVAEYLDTHEHLTTGAIAEHLSIQAGAARRYLDAVAQADGYVLLRVRGDGRGRPSLALAKPPLVNAAD